MDMERVAKKDIVGIQSSMGSCDKEDVV